VDETKVKEVKTQAAELRASIEKLSAMEKMMGAKYLQPVLRLIDAVDSL
jgi:hypothetical protein